MDRFTVKIMSYACKMTDITETGVSCEMQKTYSFTQSWDFFYVISN